MLCLSGVQPLAGIVYLVWIIYKIELCIYYALRKYDHVSWCRAGLGWLPECHAVSQFIQYRSVLAMLGQHTLVRVLHLVHQLHSYGTRHPP